VNTIGPRLLPYIEELGGAAALSPDRSPPTHAPVFLIHGSEDNIIPSSETPSLASDLERRGNTSVRFLLTPVLSHATIVGAGAGDTWRLVQFWTALLGAA
jgi:hypothetical protein